MPNQKIQPQTIDAQVARSVQLLENLLRGKDTGHQITMKPDTWEGVGPGNRIKISPREYTVTTPDGQTISEVWTVVKQGDGVTIKPVLEQRGNLFLVYLYKPHPSVGEWLLEFPSGAKNANETPEQTGARELEEETGYKAGNSQVIMKNMRFAPFRFDQNETVVEAKDLTLGARKLEYEEKPIEVHVVPQDMLRDLLEYDVIRDFRTRAITAEHLLEIHDE